MDEYEPVRIELSKEIFTNEVRDFGIHKIENFINSELFAKEFELLQNKIIPKQMV
jgi:hypothetical protein